ncbi:hypothetical protein ANPL_01715 [Anaplasma platys]|uniref:Uncharacterized protein n=1 Tax=Anaplasma platys TaxID=949 RepID=A0A858PY04_9RICK|nr:hypothetical protein [Anaplasma platys]QJC27447.1 hypothetical protein ANPL_01715 [Anaplasma platys]
MWVRFAFAVSCSMLLFSENSRSAGASVPRGDGERVQRVSEERGHAGVSGRDGAFSFHGRMLFYNSGLKGAVPTFKKRSDVDIASSLREVMRATGKEERSFGWRGGFDFSGEMSLEYSGNDGRVYGAGFMVLAPEVSGAVERGHPVVNKGSRVYVQSSYGQLSMGFQEGVESSMTSRGGFNDFIRGRDPSFIKYRLPLLKGSYFDSGASHWWLSNAALLYPGLYSESIFRANNYLDYYGIESESRYYTKYFVNNLPFRISYQSPRLAGLQFGVSYSPTGYADDLFRGWVDAGTAGPVHRYLAVRPSERLGKRDFRRAYGIGDSADGTRVSARVAGSQIVYAPVYRNVLSAVLALRRIYGGVPAKGLQVDLVLSGECAKAVTVHEGRMPRGGFHDLGSFEVSALVQGRGLSLAASYGYLGTSGYAKGPWKDTELSWDRVESSRVLKPASYVVLGAGYSLGALRVDGSYFRSRKGGYLTMARLSDLGVRVSYELYRGEDMRCELFAQVNRVSARYDFADGFVRRRLGGARANDAVVPLEYDFDSLAVGAKLLF